MILTTTQPTKQDFKVLIDQLESGLQDVLKAKHVDFVKAEKLQNLIGNCIDMYNNDNPEWSKFIQS